MLPVAPDLVPPADEVIRDDLASSGNEWHRSAFTDTTWFPMGADAWPPIDGHHAGNRHRSDPEHGRDVHHCEWHDDDRALPALGVHGRALRSAVA